METNMTLDFSHQQHNTTKWIKEHVWLQQRLLQEAEQTAIKILT